MARFAPYALFLILVCIFLWRPIFTGQALLPGDYLAQMSPWNSIVKPSTPTPQWNPLQWDSIAQFYPWRVFYARSMHSGHLPLWNPHQFCGTPFMANGQSAVLYPGNLLFLIFSPITAFTVFAALHLFLAAAFTYALMRELKCGALGGIVAAICYAFSAFMVLWLELPTFISVAVYLPLTLLLINRSVDRRSIFYAMLAGGTLALAFLAGHFQIAFYVALAATMWWVWKIAVLWRAEGQLYAAVHGVAPFVVFIIIAALIAAPQVITSQELAANSHRVREVTPEGYARFIANAVQPYRLITAFVPDFFGNPSRNTYFLGSAADYMEYGLYIGILPLMLALMALGRIRKRPYIGFFALLSLFAILSAVGTIVNAPFYYLIPGFSALGGPNRVLILYFLAIGVLAGFGIEYFTEHCNEQINWRGKSIALGKLASLVVFVVIAVLFAVTNTIAVGFVQKISSQSFPSALGLGGNVFVAFLLVSLLLLLARSGGRLGRTVFACTAVALIAADLFAFGINYNPICDRSKVYPNTPLTKKLQSIAKNSRIAPINSHWSLYKTPDTILPPNAAMVYGLYDVQGYDSLFTREYQKNLALIEDIDPSPPENGNMLLVRQLTPDLGNIAGIVLTREPVLELPGGWTSLGVVNSVHLYRTTKFRSLKSEPSRVTFEPFTFRLGLFLMLIGVAALCGVGVHRLLRYNHHQR
ncbi:MAG: YfhO family protein [Armatimonadota bacterium]|nr:YfhO family protein [bacterium]